ncbi:hypothetical protein P4O66_017202 [Electrophorus voltai]|uniref:Uncharacterized protein n=1 Tax=Electrophorus voltai TaxID=2609070 RepID=A0AAD8YT61_9TELE|nr:hypothetical protein P4O66_017202 [Electrophorus voltai]
MQVVIRAAFQHLADLVYFHSASISSNAMACYGPSSAVDPTPLGCRQPYTGPLSATCLVSISSAILQGESTEFHLIASLLLPALVGGNDSPALLTSSMVALRAVQAIQPTRYQDTILSPVSSQEDAITMLCFHEGSAFSLPCAVRATIPAPCIIEGTTTIDDPMPVPGLPTGHRQPPTHPVLFWASLSVIFPVPWLDTHTVIWVVTIV